MFWNILNLLVIILGGLAAVLYRNYLWRKHLRDGTMGHRPSFRDINYDTLYPREVEELVKNETSVVDIESKRRLRVMSGILVVFGLLSLTACAEIPQKTSSVYVQTRSCFRPTLAFHDVYGRYTDVVAVKLVIAEPPMEIPLGNTYGRTWLTQMNSYEIQSLVKDMPSSYQGKILVKSDNGKTADTTTENVEVHVEARDSSTCT